MAMAMEIGIWLTFEPVSLSCCILLRKVFGAGCLLHVLDGRRLA